MYEPYRIDALVVDVRIRITGRNLSPIEYVYRLRNGGRSGSLILEEPDAAPLPVGVAGWDTRIEHVLPSERYPIHALIAKLYGPNSQLAQGKVGAILRRGPDIVREEDAVRFDDVYLQPGEGPHYSMTLFSPFRPKERLPDGRYELRWIEEHGVGHRDLTEPHVFEIRQGMVVTNA